MIYYDKLQVNLKRLELQFENYLLCKDRPELKELDREGIAESVIQRFETCYDTLWKVLKRYLGEEIGLADVPNSPKAVIKVAAQHDLLPSCVEKWLAYANARTDTAHDYSGDKAASTLTVVKDFIDDAIALYKKMSLESWQ